VRFRECDLSSIHHRRLSLLRLLSIHSDSRLLQHLLEDQEMDARRRAGRYLDQFGCRRSSNRTLTLACHISANHQTGQGDCWLMRAADGRQLVVKFCLRRDNRCSLLLHKSVLQPPPPSLPHKPLIRSCQAGRTASSPRDHVPLHVGPVQSGERALAPEFYTNWQPDDPALRTDSGVPYVVMEALDGISLKQWIHHRGSSKQPSKDDIDAFVSYSTDCSASCRPVPRVRERARSGVVRA